MENVIEGNKGEMVFSFEMLQEALRAFGMSGVKSMNLACFIHGYHTLKVNNPGLINKLYPSNITPKPQ